MQDVARHLLCQVRPSSLPASQRIEQRHRGRTQGAAATPVVHEPWVQERFLERVHLLRLPWYLSSIPMYYFLITKLLSRSLLVSCTIWPDLASSFIHDFSLKSID